MGRARRPSIRSIFRNSCSRLSSFGDASVGGQTFKGAPFWISAADTAQCPSTRPALGRRYLGLT